MEISFAELNRFCRHFLGFNPSSCLSNSKSSLSRPTLIANLSYSPQIRLFFQVFGFEVIGKK